jgi:hypothetical protein
MPGSCWSCCGRAEPQPVARPRGGHLGHAAPGRADLRQRVVVVEALQRHARQQPVVGALGQLAEEVQELAEALDAMQALDLPHRCTRPFGQAEELDAQAGALERLVGKLQHHVALGHAFGPNVGGDPVVRQARAGEHQMPGPEVADVVADEDPAARLAAHRGVQFRQRLVEQEHLGRAHDRPADRDAPALAARQLLGPALQVLREVQDLGRALDLLLAHRHVDLGELERERHVVDHRHVRVHAGSMAELAHRERLVDVLGGVVDDRCAGGSRSR